MRFLPLKSKIKIHLHNGNSNGIYEKNMSLCKYHDVDNHLVVMNFYNLSEIFFKNNSAEIMLFRVHVVFFYAEYSPIYQMSSYIIIIIAILSNCAVILSLIIGLQFEVKFI